MGGGPIPIEVVRMRHIPAISILLLLAGCATAPTLPVEKKTVPDPDWWSRERLPARCEQVQLDGLAARFYTPHGGTGPWPPVVMLSGSQGGMASLDKVRALVVSGYCVVTPAYIERGEELISVPLEFFDKTLAWLNRNSRVAQGGVAVVGTSKGGELALLLASRNPEVKAVVGIVPSSYVFQGIARRRHSHSSWSDNGKDIPFLPYPVLKAWLVSMTTGKFRDVYMAGWKQRRRFPEARIPLEKANAAILLLSAEQDQMWPSRIMCEDTIRHVKDSNYAYPFEHVTYEGDHAVGNRKEHWVKITGFLRDHYAVNARTTKSVSSEAAPSAAPSER